MQPKYPEYAIDDEEYNEGVRCVTASIKENDKVITALNVIGSIFMMTKKRIENESRNLVINVTKDISAEYS